MQSVSFISIFYGCIVGRKRYSYCNDTEDLVVMELHYRNQETNDVDIKLSADVGQGFFKVTLSITLKPELENNKIPKKLSKCDGYACKDFKDFKCPQNYYIGHFAFIVQKIPKFADNFG